MSKKILALILSVAMVCSLCLVPAGAAGQGGVSFADARGNWAEKSIERWAAAGIVTGDHNGNVTPDQNLTRAELATILVRLLGLTQTAPANTFRDVSSSDWFADAILKCAAAGIMEGWDGSAHPNDPITREQAITMVGRALGVKAQPGQDLSKFSDADQVFDYAVAYMAPLTAMGILSGVADGSRVAPKAHIDRASALALLDKAIGAYVTASGDVSVNDANKFIIVNAASGEVNITGAAAGVLIANGNKAAVKLNKVDADTVKVDSPVTVTVTNSTLGSVDVNANATVSVDRSSKVDTVDTIDAPGANVDNNGSTTSSSSGRPSSGGGGGGGSVVTGAYTISVDTAAHGTVTVSPRRADAGKTVTVTVRPAAGYELDALTATGVETMTKVSDTRYTFVMPAQNVTVTATFKAIGAEPEEPTYTVTCDTADHGTVTADKAAAKAGETVTLTVVPAQGYELDTLTVNGVAIAGTTFPMPAQNVTVTATFKKTAVGPVDPVGPDETTYTVTCDTAAHGAVTADKAAAKAGEAVTLTIAPAQGYELDALTVNGQSVTVTGSTYTFPMPAGNVTVTATFKATATEPVEPESYTVTCGAAVNGAVTADKAAAKAGETVTLTIAPAQGYELDALTVNGQSVTVTGSTYTFPMPAGNVTVTATFKATAPTPVELEDVTIALTVAGDAAGAVDVTLTGTGVSAEGNVYTVKEDTVVTVAVTFKEGKNAAEYTVTCDTIANFEVTSNNTFTVTTATTAVTVTVVKKEQAAPLSVTRP